MFKHLTDEKLVSDALSGSMRAYESLVNRHKRYVFSIAYRMVKNNEEAEEVAQDSFLKAFLALGSYRSEAKFTTWLYRIAYTTSISRLRKKNIPIDPMDDSAFSIACDDGDTDDLTTNNIKKRYIQKTFERLPPHDATVLQLYYISQLSLQEISEILNVSSDVVKIKLYRARQRFKNEIENFMGVEAKHL